MPEARGSLVERMVQAAAAKAAERRAGAAPPAAPAPAAAARTQGPGHKAAPSVAPKPPQHAPPTPEPRPAPQAHGPSWQPAGRPGLELVLMPGQMHFGAQVASLRTLLGSCVAITLWHPQRRIGGMCHYLLPGRTRGAADARDGRYGDEAVEAMVELLRHHRTQPQEYVAHLYGGADTMPEGTQLRFNVGERNIEQGWSLIDKYGFQLDGVDVGEDVPRTVTLTLATGAVDMRRGQGKAPANAALGART